MTRTCYTCDRDIPDEEFDSYDDVSKSEYGLSRMCLDPCQNAVFDWHGSCWCGGDHDDWDEEEEEGDD